MTYTSNSKPIGVLGYMSRFEMPIIVRNYVADMDTESYVMRRKQYYHWDLNKYYWDWDVLGIEYHILIDQQNFN